MADGRDHVALELVDQAELRHVLEQHGGAEQPVVAADRQDAGEEEPLLAVVAEAERMLQARRQVVGAAAEDLGQHGLERGGRPTGPSLVRRGHPEEAAGRRVGPLDGAGRVDDHHRVGERVDRRLRRLLRPQQPGGPGLLEPRIVRAIELNAAASSPSSSRVSTGTTWSRSPRAIARAARVTARIGSRIDRLSSSAISVATAAEPSSATTISRIDRAAACPPEVLVLHVLLI